MGGRCLNIISIHYSVTASLILRLARSQAQNLEISDKWLQIALKNVT